MKKSVCISIIVISTVFGITRQVFAQIIRGESNFKPVKSRNAVQQNFQSGDDCDRIKAAARLSLENVKLSDANGNNILEADEKINLTFDLVNQGEGQGCSVHLSLTELSNSGAGISLPEGETIKRILPGERKQISWDFSGNMNQKDSEMKLVLFGKEYKGWDTDSFFIRRLRVQSFQPPRVEIADAKFSSPSGKMEAGVTIHLRAAVQNLGRGKAENVQIRLGLPETNIYLSSESPIIQIGELQPGESKLVDFEFIPNKRYTKPDVPCLLSISERFDKYGGDTSISVRMNTRIATLQGLDVIAIEYKQEKLIKATLNSEVDKNIPETKEKNPNGIAVVIGNRNYQKTKVVEHALNDAASIRNYLVKAMGFSDENIIFTQDASLSDMNTIFGKERSKGRLNDKIKPGMSDVFIFYSGHGAPDVGDGGENKGYLVPVDCDPNYVSAGGYALETLYGNLERLPARSLSVILDACFSGEEIIQKASPLRLKTKLPEVHKAVVLASSKENQLSNWYPEQEHGLFTYYFLKAIQDFEKSDQNRDGKLSFNEIYGVISDPIDGIPFKSKNLFGNSREQNPVLIGENKDQILVTLGK